MGELDNMGQDAETINFPATALFLARNYANLRTEQKNIREWLDRHRVFTTDMAIEELMSISPQSEGERVQTSSLSDQTALIAEKLAGGYVERRQRQLERKAASYDRELSYIEWKTGIVDEAMEKRMTRSDAAFFRLMFVRNKKYREIRETHKGKQIYDHDVRKKKTEVLGAVEDELRFRNCWRQQRLFMKMLAEETAKETTGETARGTAETAKETRLHHNHGG